MVKTKWPQRRKDSFTASLCIGLVNEPIGSVVVAAVALGCSLFGHWPSSQPYQRVCVCLSSAMQRVGVINYLLIRFKTIYAIATPARQQQQHSDLRMREASSRI